MRTSSLPASALLFGVVALVVVRDSPHRDVDAPPPLAAGEVLGSLREAWAEPGTRLAFWVHFTTSCAR